MSPTQNELELFPSKILHLGPLNSEQFLALCDQCKLDGSRIVSAEVVEISKWKVTVIKKP